MDVELAPASATPSPSFDGPMTWRDVMEHPSLQDLPFKIEQDAWGRLIMSPTSHRHARMQGRIQRLLAEQIGGEAYPECPISTPEGTKVPDVVWMSDEFADGIVGAPDVLPKAPEICIEVRSPSNPEAEMQQKVALYLAKGAREVWICEVDGAVRFFSHEGPLERSRLAPGFPTRL